MMHCVIGRVCFFLTFALRCGSFWAALSDGATMRWLTAVEVIAAKPLVVARRKPEHTEAALSGQCRLATLPKPEPPAGPVSYLPVLAARRTLKGSLTEIVVIVIAIADRSANLAIDRMPIGAPAVWAGDE
uniref:Uncharacterized protein n=1 Tax=Anopheles atroparvus TaxID=41427 RepID=A0A182IN02_ANOAO